MSNKVKKYNWVYSNRVQYTLEEYMSKIHELISSPVTQMRECDGDLFMSEYQKLIEGERALDRLIAQLKEDKE